MELKITKEWVESIEDDPRDTIPVGPFQIKEDIRRNKMTEKLLTLEEFKEKTGIEDEEELLEAYEEYKQNVQLLEEGGK